MTAATNLPVRPRRVPSEYAVRLSTHNSADDADDFDESGEATIRELKRANGELADRLAAQERERMNELAALADELAELRSQKLADDAELARRGDRLSVLSGEASHRRHEVSSLKRELAESRRSRTTNTTRARREDDRSDRLERRRLERRVRDLESDLDESRAAAAAQERYRSDEADDLRALLDEQEIELAVARRDLESARRELERLRSSSAPKERPSRRAARSATAKRGAKAGAAGGDDSEASILKAKLKKRLAEAQRLAQQLKEMEEGGEEERGDDDDDRRNAAVSPPPKAVDRSRPRTQSPRGVAEFLFPNAMG